MTLSALIVAAWAITIVLTAFLIWGFVRTRNFGYLVLLLPFTLWQFISIPIGPLIDTQIGLIDSRRALEFPFSVFGELTKGELIAIVQLGSSTIRGLLILLGFYLLIKRTPRQMQTVGGSDAPLAEDVSVPA
jgi:hypothetical protein